MPKCKCCGQSECFTESDRMVVTLSGLPHENYGRNLKPVGGGWSRGLSYLDGYGGEYVLYKTYDKPNAGVPNTPYSGRCVFTYWDGYGDSIENGVTTFGIRITYRHGYDRFGNFQWDRSVWVRVLGGTIEWSDSGIGSAPSPAITYIAADLTENASSESELFGGYLWVPKPWTLTATTCELAVYDDATHATALKPCECFNLPVDILNNYDTLYKSTCLTYNGTADPGTDDYSSVYHPHGNCDPGSLGGIYCSPFVAENSLAVGPYTLLWRDYGTDEIDLTISDLVLYATTLSTAGTYTLPYGGMYRDAWVPNCIGNPYPSGYPGVFGPGWAAAFPFTHEGSTHAIFLSVSLGRTELERIYDDLIYPPSRRLYVGVAVVGPSGMLPGAVQIFQSDGLQSEDTYGCGNMPTVSGGDGVSGTRYFTACPATAYQWTWSVSQA